LNVPDSWRRWWDPLIHEAPWANRLASAALLLMAIGAVLTIWRGRWYARLMLLLGAVIWPLPDYDVIPRGEVILIVIPGHGLHSADMLSIVAVVVALIPWAGIWRAIGRLRRHERRAPRPSVRRW
jgi:hypothetical protein